ncbi:hypothetical protein HHK36_005757 [Tetracentron sinense]|uniref:non-specific serine/threonine protein kinase n=1 Tax=Tetracentron sinense TaxID=13715 RepID=A0A835DMJ6_TETSI|nr:hypothetical protein HHK36_005757 [Tetracentron sinense]
MGKKSSSLLIFLLLLQLSSKLRSDQQLPKSEVDALKTIAEKLRLKQLRYSNDSCRAPLLADGIKCDFCGSTTCHVTNLTFPNQDLTGEIAQEVANLTYLKELDLSGNQLYGSIPVSLGNLSSLSILDLSSNYLIGPIPASLGSIQSLKRLYLYNNFLNGYIPPTLGALTSLQFLSLGQNRLSGPVPDELGNITTLEFLGLQENLLSGDLPKGLGNLSKLRSFYMSSNNLTGELPQSFSKLSSLRVLSLHGNYMSGRIPDFIKSWTNLSTLILGFQNTNNPDCLYCTSLVTGHSWEMILKGPLPDISTLKMLEELWVSDLRNSNGLQFPELSTLKNLNSLILRNCSITGQIPSYIGDLSSLTYLDLSFNKLTGHIPSTISNLKLEFVYFTGNMLNGSIPGVLLNSSLNYGSSPLKLMDVYCPRKKLKYNSLYINCGGENIAIEGNNYEEDNKISAFHVSPKGSWAYSRSGDSLSFDSSPRDYIRNMSCGISVPDAPLYSTARLSPQSLKYYGLCLHNGNYTVKLHFAEIIYTDDKDYSILGKRVFDVYIQEKRVEENFNIIDKARGANRVFLKNYTAVVEKNLLEIHFYWAGKGSTYIRPGLHGPLISAISVTPDFKPDSGKISASTITIIIVASAGFFLLVLASLWKMGWVGRKGKRHDELRGLELQGSFFSFYQIKAATQNFSSENKIGEGGFGAVYKGILPNGMQIAVKQLSSKSKQGTHQFVTEVGTMTSLSHPNLVKLLGCCTEDHQLLLIYEYMENNSLAHGLFGNIVLLYLIVILFGSGYMAPEYAMRGILTDKADVYSFGVVILEIVSGKYNAENRPNHEIAFLLDMAYVLKEEGKLIELVDPVLGSDFRVDEATMILDLAILCTNTSPTLRPTMLEVVSILEGKKTTKKALYLGRPDSSGKFERATTLCDLSLSTQPASTSMEKTPELFSSYMSSKDIWETESLSVDCSNEIAEETVAMLKTT